MRDQRIGVIAYVFMIGSLVSPAGLCAQSGAPAGSQDDVQKCLASLRGSTPDERAAAAACLGKLGTRAAIAVPRLIDMLADASTLVWDGIGPGGRPSGGSFAARASARSALLGIGEPALQPLIDALQRPWNHWAKRPLRPRADRRTNSAWYWRSRHSNAKPSRKSTDEVRRTRTSTTY